LVPPVAKMPPAMDGNGVDFTGQNVGI
jgi:hypothetical protein